jgi:hypothetical protein
MSWFTKVFFENFMTEGEIKKNFSSIFQPNFQSSSIGGKKKA